MHVTDILPTLLAIADIADQTCDKDCSLSGASCTELYNTALNIIIVEQSDPLPPVICHSLHGNVTQ